jgi:hypothetical protein
MALGFGAGSWAAAEGPLVKKRQPAGVTAPGFVAAGFSPSAGGARRADFAGGGLGAGGNTTSVWGSVEAGPECQVGWLESACREREGGRGSNPSCGAPSGVATARRYNPAAARASLLEASMRLTRVIRTSFQLSAVSYQQEHRGMVGHRQGITVPFSNRNPLVPGPSPPRGRGGTRSPLSTTAWQKLRADCS